MIEFFKIPVLFILTFLISKEIFSYDSEKIVILCILSFIIIMYFSFKDTLYSSFIARSEKLQEEYIDLINLNQKLQKRILDVKKIF